jgi:hypothetical protein
VIGFLDHISHLSNTVQDFLIFPSGCEFLVCNVEKKGKYTHIYLREVELGLGASHSALWLDPKI